MANLHDLMAHYHKHMAHYHNQVVSYNEGTTHSPTPVQSQVCQDVREQVVPSL